MIKPIHGFTTLAARLALLVLCIALSSTPVSAQLQTQITTPMNSVSDGFYERIGVNFGFNIRGRNGNVFFNQGGFNEALPPFGGHSPNSDGGFGFAVLNKNADFFFNFAAGQGSTRTAISQAPSVTSINGIPATFTDTVQRPFVTGIVPVVGRRPEIAPPPSPLYQRIQNYYQQRRLDELRKAGEEGARRAELAVAGGFIPEDRSTATQGDLSVAELRRRRTQTKAAEQAAADQEVAALIERGRGAEEAGKRGVAKIYYQMSAKRVEGELKNKLLAKVKDLSK